MNTFFAAFRLATRPAALSPSVSPFYLPRYYSAGIPLPSIEEVQQRVIKIVSQFDKVDPVKVNDKAHFINDLGLDSLDAVELVMALEDEFCIEVPEADLENIVSVDRAIAYIRTHPHAK